MSIVLSFALSWGLLIRWFERRDQNALIRGQ